MNEEVEVTQDEQHQPDREFQVEARGVKLTLIETTHKKGRAKGNIAYFVKTDMSAPDPFADIKKIVGVETFNRAVMQYVIRPNCNDATHEAKDPETGQVSDVNWVNAFAEQFLPTSRKSGTGIKALREKAQEILENLQPFMLRLAHKEQLPPEDNNRYLQLVVEYADVQEAIQSKQRTGKKSNK